MQRRDEGVIGSVGVGGGAAASEPIKATASKGHVASSDSGGPGLQVRALAIYTPGWCV